MNTIEEDRMLSFCLSLKSKCRMFSEMSAYKNPNNNLEIYNGLSIVCIRKIRSG